MRALATSIQVKGLFYNRAGRKAAIDEIVTRIENNRVNKPDAFENPPPRLKRAQEFEIPLHPDAAPKKGFGRHDA